MLINAFLAGDLTKQWADFSKKAAAVPPFAPSRITTPDFRWEIFLDTRKQPSYTPSRQKQCLINPEAPDLKEPISAIFKNSIKQSDTIVLPLWIASDHVHVYVEISGKISLDKIARKIKKATERKLICLKGMDRMHSKAPLWDDTYFVETIG